MTTPISSMSSTYIVLEALLSVLDLQVTKMDDHFSESFRFWTEGVIQIVIATIGLLLNAVGVLVLLKKSMRNSFNILFLALVLFDSLFLIMSIQSSIRIHKEFHIHAKLIVSIFYPLHSISLAGSIYMTMAIALERYLALRNPYGYLIAMEKPNALIKRVLAYVLPVILLAILINITKFAELEYVQGYYEHPVFIFSVLVSEDWFLLLAFSDELGTHLQVTSLRLDHTYVVAYLVVSSTLTGFIPFVCLIIANVKIYQMVKIHRLSDQNSHDDELISSTVEMEDLHAVGESRIQEDGQNSQELKAAKAWKQERQLGIVFVAYGITFLTCNFFRIFVNMLEVCSVFKVNSYHKNLLLNK